MSEELVCQHGGVGFDLHDLDGHDGNFGEYHAAQGVGEAEVYVGEGEVDVVCSGLAMGVRVRLCYGGWRGSTSVIFTVGPLLSVSITIGS